MNRANRKRKCKTAIYKHNMKIMRQYHALYPDDVFFEAVPNSCFYAEDIDSEDHASSSIAIQQEDVPPPEISTPNQLLPNTSDHCSMANIDVRDVQVTARRSPHQLDNTEVGGEEELHQRTLEEDDQPRTAGHDGDSSELDTDKSTENEGDTTADETDPANTDNTPSFLQICALDIPLMPRSQLSAKDHLISILAIAVRNNFTYEATLNVFQWINTIYGFDCLPTTKNILWATLGRDNNAISRHMYCKNCMMYLGKGSEPAHQCNCTDCGPEQNNSSLRFFISLSLRSQLTQFLSIPNIAESLQYRVTRIKKYPEAIEDIYDGAEYRRLCMPGNFLSDPNNLSFTFNTDGCNVANSSTASAWPIYVQINELPPHLRKKHMLLAGIFVDEKHPVMNYFLEPFVTEMQNLYNEGIQWKPTATSEVVSKFAVIVATVDSVARPAILRMKQFNGKYGCTMCYAEGEHCQGKRVYPVSHSFGRLRTDTQVRADMQQAATSNEAVRGVKGPSVLMLLREFDLIKGTVVDGMHCCHLGVAKQHTQLLFKSTNHKARYYVGLPYKKAIVNHRLLSIRPHNRRSRLPRSLECFKQWKASELRNWIDYSSVCLLGVLPTKYLDHFAQFAEAMHILNRDCITLNELNRAKRMLRNYVRLFEKYYGKQNMSFNIHLLTHLLETVKNWGPLWAHSAYPFESWNNKIMNKVTSPHSRCNQICDRFLLSKFLENSVYDESVSSQTKKTVSKLLKIPLRPENAREKVCGMGKSERRGPNTVEKRALLSKGYDPESLRSFSKAIINGVFYKCDRGRKTKFCNSIAYCKEIGFGEIIDFVTFRFVRRTTRGVFIKRLKLQPSRLKSKFIQRVRICNEVIFVPAENIEGPAMTIRISNNQIYALKLPNCWETD